MARGTLLTVAISAALISAVACSTDHPASDCENVQQMIAYNRSHTEKIAAESDAENPSETPISDYSAWAAKMGEYASHIANPDLAAHAEKAADLAGQSVSIVEEARNDSNQPTRSGPPPWVKRYAEIDSQFRAELESLRTACPA